MASSDQIRSYIEGKFGTSVGDDDSLLDSGRLDSIGIFELVTFLEETFRIKIEDEAIVPEHFETIGLIAAFVDSRGADAPA